MRLRPTDLLGAVALTSVACFLLLYVAGYLIEPCILQGRPRPADYPEYCDLIGRSLNTASVYLLLIATPLILFVGSLLVISKVRSR